MKSTSSQKPCYTKSQICNSCMYLIRSSKTELAALLFTGHPFWTAKERNFAVRRRERLEAVSDVTEMHLRLEKTQHIVWTGRQERR